MSVTRTTIAVLAVLAAVILAFSASGFAADEVKATNLAPNAGAEKGVAGKLPEGWSHYVNTRDEAGVTDKEFYTGKRCAFLKVLGFGDDARACTGLAVGKTNGFSAPNGIVVKPDTTYHFSFYIAGAGFKRKITAGPWGFNEVGKEKDRNIIGISVLPKPEWTRYTGTFKTKAGTRKVVLMFFVYGLEGRDIKEGATFYVDNVYLGEAEPPAAVKGSAKIKLPPPAPVPTGATVGYKPLPKGKVRIWDTMSKRSGFGAGWNLRSKWVHIPYGKLDYKFQGDPIIEGHNFWVGMRSRGRSGISIFAKMDAAGTPSSHVKVYRSYDAPVTLQDSKYRGGERPGKLRCYGGLLARVKILKNQPGELIVESSATPHIRPGFKKGYSVNVSTAYRIQGGKSWVEIKPVRQVSELGLHGETRLAVCPEAGKNGADAVADSWRHPATAIINMPTSKMMFDYMIDRDVLLVMTWPNPAKAKPYNINCAGGATKGWSRIGEGSSPKIITSPFARFGDEKEPIYIGILVHGYSLYQKIDRPVKAGQKITGNWKWSLVPWRGRHIRGSRWRHGKPWMPTYPGKWRLTGCIDGKYYTQEVLVTKADTKKDTFSFTAPAAGKLEYLIFYLYDRTDQTPADVVTPMDIHRQTQAEFKGKHRTSKSKGKGQ